MASRTCSNTQPLPKEVQAKAEGNAPSEAVAAEPEAAPESEVAVNPIFSKLNWPPQGTLMNPKPKAEEEEPRKSPWPK
jgi:hypothetical protein